MVERDEVPEALQGYSIRVASRLTGITSDTLRMWERRYGFPKPARNDSQVRVYTDADIERLVLISRTLKAGFRSGEVIHRNTEELRGLLATSARAETNEPRTPTLDSLLKRLIADDPDGLRDELRQSVALLGPRQFLIEVAAPLVERVGEAWADGRIGVRHEHLASEVISSQLRLLLSAYEGRAEGPVALLAGFTDEKHSLGIHMVALYLALDGVTPRVLGVNTPPDQVAEAAVALSAQVVGITISSSSEAAVTEAHLRRLLAALPNDKEVWLGGSNARKVTLRDARLQRVVTWSEVDHAVARLRANFDADA